MTRRRSTSDAVLATLRGALTGAAVRTMSGIRDAGEALLAKLSNLDGGDHVAHVAGDPDVWVHYEDHLSGYGGVAKLFFPLNVLFGTPPQDDNAMVVRPRDAGGPGVAYALHGDGGRGGLPGWIRSKVGLWNAKPVRVESTGGAVEVKSDYAGSGANLVLNDGVLNVARVTDLVNIGTITGAVAPGGGPVTFTYTPFNADGSLGTPVISQTILLSGVISSEPDNGAPYTMA